MILSLTTHSHIYDSNFNFLRRTNKKYKNVHPSYTQMSYERKKPCTLYQQYTCMSLACIHVKYFSTIAYCT